MRRSAQATAAETPAAARGAPRLASFEQLQSRQQGVWWGSHLFSLAVHAAFAAWIVQTGVIVVEYSQRLGFGYQFGQAVMLASPLFEIGQRSAVRGQQRQIPLSALVPEGKLYAPDLRRIAALRPPQAGQLGRQNTAEERLVSSEASASVINVPLSGGGALPSGSLPQRVAGGVSTPFDLVPPSNTRAQKGNQGSVARIRIGDASIPGGGAIEGLRLAASPSRLGIEAETEADAASAPEMEEWLRVFVSRLRRASFDVIPDRRDAGAPGVVAVRVEVDSIGRIVRSAIAMPSGNPALDRLAMALLGQVPGWQPLPQILPSGTAAITVRLRYHARR